MAETEAAFRRDVVSVLDAVGDEYRREIRKSTELVAARFSVSTIAAIWDRHIPRLLRSLRGLVRRGATQAQEDVGVRLPDSWDPTSDTGDWAQETRRLLADVGDRMAAAATQSLADGLNAGETQEQLRVRLLTLFSDSGAQLGPARASRIAATESTRAYNAGVLSAAEALATDERPLVKQWRTRMDEKVRPTHNAADGQIRLLDDVFDVGSSTMRYPGDPLAPADETIECRCRLELSARRTASLGDVPEGAAPTIDLEAAAVTEHTGAMIALIPREEDAGRLAIPGGEPVEELHLTLFYLGEAADWSAGAREELISSLSRWAPQAPVYANAFGVNHWNPMGDSPCWVYAVGDSQDGEAESRTLQQARGVAVDALENLHEQPEIPFQHSPWAPHVCAAYTDNDDPLMQMPERTGPVVFDRIRVAFAGEYADILLQPDEDAEEWPQEPEPVEADIETPALLPWSTPEGTALAFENQETGDGRIFAPGSLYWENGPWPLQFADEMLDGHSGAELAGCIDVIGREGDRVTGSGSMYMSRSAGWEAAQLLAQGAPLGVSVDLDDVTLQYVDHAGAVFGEDVVASASVLQHADGWSVTLTGSAQWDVVASSGLVSRTVTTRFELDRDARVNRSVVTAAAGDPDRDGTVVHEESAGDLVMRITSGRVRGATLVTIPAFSQARIVLEPAPPGYPPFALAAASGDEARDTVVEKVRGSVFPLTAADVAETTGLPVAIVRRHLAEAVERNDVVRISRGTYLPVKGLAAAATGNTDYPLADREAVWNSTAAAGRVLAWATDADGNVSADKLGSAYLWVDPDKDPATASAYKLGHVDIVDGDPVIVPRAVFSIAGVLQGAMGGVDIPEADVAGVKAKVDALYSRMSDEFGEELTPPWEQDGEGMSASADADDELAASAWAAMQDLPPMPAAWFREPTVEELPPGSAGVQYRDGRVYGWVAQAGEPHAGYAQKITIDTLGRIDTTHFLRQRFALDDGSQVKAGAFTMNTGHHRDGAECETGACAFDDSRTVAAIVTVGMNERGMWFSGAAHPALSEWDRRVFMALQPSYHLKQGSNGWQLRGVLAVPVPGHSSPLLASAVIERTNMALAASAAMALPKIYEVSDDDLMADNVPEVVVTSLEAVDLDYDRLADAIVASMVRSQEQQAAEAAELALFAATMLEDSSVGDIEKGA